MNRTPHPVHPPLSELIALEAAASGLSFLANQPLNSVLAGPHGSRLRGRGLDFAELRRYVPGDDLRRLDLRASLRYGKPFVRSYSEERDRPAMIVVDQRMSMYFGSVRAFKCAVAARLAAIAAWIAYRGGDRVGGLVFDDAGVKAFKPLRSRDRVRALLAEVARANANLSAAQPDVPAAQGLNRALRGALLNAPHDYLVCIVSDFAGADAETLRTLRLLAAHNDVLAMLVFDPMGQQLPRKGRLVVTQGELQLEVAVGRRREREPLAHFFSDRLRQVAELLRRSRVPLLSIDTAEDELSQLRRELGKTDDGVRRAAATRGPGMSDPLPGLDQLRELPLPAAVSYWPQTWGWAVLAVVVVVGGAWAGAAVWRRHRRNLYRRQGLKALRQLEQEAASDPLAARGLPALLKRTALAAQPPDGRAGVASLSGAAWLAYLERAVPQGFPKNSPELMRLLAYAPDETVRRLDSAALSQLIGASREWMVKHHVAA